jgi:vacuolar-type H+-ATPase subunit E/Vma4
MGLHGILEAIRSAGEASVSEIENRAYAQAHQILANARLEVERLREQACTAAIEPTAHERARLIHRARLEAMQTTGSARKELVDAALEQVRGQLAVLRTDACYPEVLRQLLKEALSELVGSRPEGNGPQSKWVVCLEADPLDQSLLEDLLRALELNVPVSYSLQCCGGVVAKSENGRIVVINTLEARLERVTPYLRRYLAVYFEDEHSDIGIDRGLEYQLTKEN